MIVFAGLPSPLSIPAGVIRLLLWLTKCLISALLWLLSATSGNHKAIRKIFLLEILGKFYLYFNLRANTGNVYIFKSLLSFARRWQEQRRRWIFFGGDQSAELTKIIGFSEDWWNPDSQFNFVIFIDFSWDKWCCKIQLRIIWDLLSSDEDFINLEKNGQNI